ncbi:MAG: VrrA/YqfQ family protein [Bacilli bacterium]|nr:VrrA/YqfQ family protein [Bacilli bacterium]
MFSYKPNPFFNPYSYSLATKSAINWGSLLTNTQKTLGVINQAIPVFYQIGPVYRNARTLFKVMSEFNKASTNNSSSNRSSSNSSSTNSSNNASSVFNNPKSNLKLTTTNTSDSTNNNPYFNNQPNFFL